MKTAGIRPFDVLAALALGLFVVMAILVYRDRFVLYRGSAHTDEFGLYAAAVIAAVALVWRRARVLPWPPHLVALLALAVGIHFLGAVPLGEAPRIYDLTFAGIRYDKLVHFVNGFIAGRCALWLLPHMGIELPARQRWVVVLLVLGLGALCEIVEYLVLLTVPGAGVGGYDNNLQDLIADGLGAALSQLAPARRRA